MANSRRPTALAATLATTALTPSFRLDGRVVALTPLPDPTQPQPLVYRFPCPRCGRDRKIGAFRLQIPATAPDLLTIDGLVHCPHECGWVAEVVRGQARALGRDHG